MTSRRSNHTNESDVIITVEDSAARIAIIDDHRMFARLLEMTLDRPGVEVCGVFDGSEDDLFDEIVATRPDVILLDLYLNGRWKTSLPLIRQLAEAGHAVVVITASDDRLDFAACVEAGARGVVEKSASFEVLLDAVQLTLAGMPLLSDDERFDLIVDLRAEREVQRRVMGPFAMLTKRESEVLAALCMGKSAAEIAETSFVSMTTVRSQIRSVLAKLGVTSQLAAVGMARRAGWNG